MTFAVAKTLPDQIKDPGHAVNLGSMSPAFSVRRSLPKAIRTDKQKEVKLGDLTLAFSVRCSLPKPIKTDKRTAVKLGNLSPAFAIRRSA